MSLKLEKPLVTLDVETTGTDPEVNRVIQIGLIKLYPDGHETEWKSYVNPGVPIPSYLTREVHGITDEDVANAPTFASLAPMLANGLREVDLCGFSLKFDLDFLSAEFKRADVAHSLNDVRIADVYEVLKLVEPRSLIEATKRHLGEDLEGAHDALVDARATLRLLQHFVKTRSELPKTVDGFHKLVFETAPPGFIDPGKKFRWEGSEAVVAFGKKHNGHALQDVAQQDRGFLEWMIRSDFPSMTKKIARDALKGQYPKKETQGPGGD